MWLTASGGVDGGVLDVARHGPAGPGLAVDPPLFHPVCDGILWLMVMSVTSADVRRLVARTLMVGFPAGPLDAETRHLIHQGVRAFILFARNVGSREQVRALTAELRQLAGHDAIIGIDHEGGRVNRLREAVSPWPGPMAWSAAGDPDLVQNASTVMARELAALGITLNFAPVADILGSHLNPVLTTRCFSDDPQMAARFVRAFVQGHEHGGIHTSAKHFPGHGGTAVDSHLALPRVDHTATHLLGNDLVPFRAAVAAGASSLMVSHVWYPDLDPDETPATLSANAVRLARGPLGFTGPIVTDSMEMGAITTHLAIEEGCLRAMSAGNDLLAVCHRPDQQLAVLDRLTRAVHDGELALERVRAAAARVDTLGRPEGTYPYPAGGTDLARELARRAVTIVRDEQGYLPLRLNPEQPLGVVTFPTVASSQVEEGERQMAPLAAAIRARHAVVAVQAGREGEVIPDLEGVETVVVGTAFTTGRPEQARVVNALLAAGKRVVAVGLRDPFDLLSFPRVPCYLVAYDDLPVSAEAAAGVLFGEIEARGRLPVSLPGLYARGHGLTR